MGWASEYIARLQNGETVQFRPRGNSMKAKAIRDLLKIRQFDFH